MITERRPATTIGELDIHLGFLMEEVTQMRQEHDKMMAMLATKQEVAEKVAELKAMINGNSVGAFWRRLTEISVGVVALCTAVGFIVAVVHFFKA
jgi:regulator of replication initiation timing